MAENYKNLDSYAVRYGKANTKGIRITRTNAEPWDVTDVFDSIAALDNYLATSPVVYAGQLCAVVNNDQNIVTVYKVTIEPDTSTEPASKKYGKEEIGAAKLSSSYAKAETYTEPAAGDTLDVAIGKLAKGIENAAAGGVQSVGGQAGIITLRGSQTGSGDVNLSMNGKEIEASIVGLKSAAFAETSAFDASGSAALAESSSKAYAKPAVDYVAASSSVLDGIKTKVIASSASWDTAASWVDTNGANVVASASVAKEASDWISANKDNLASTASWNAAASWVGSNSASYHNTSWDTAASWVGSHSSSLETVEASASLWNGRLDKVEATASANSESIVKLFASASDHETRLSSVETATGSYMKVDGSNSNVKYQLNFSDSASAIKYDSATQEFQFIFN